MLFSKDLPIFQQIQTWCVEFKERKKKKRVRKRGREENIQRKERGRRRKREIRGARGGGMLEKTLESPLNCKKNQPVNPKGNPF